MNSQKFIEINRETWDRLQNILDRIERRGVSGLSREELESVGPLFRRTASHLAQAQGNFPDVADYLNRLVARAHSHLYRTESFSWRNIFYFYTRGFPKLVRVYRYYFLAAAAVLVASAVWGAALNHYGSGLAGLALPEEIREAVNQNFARGETGVKIDNSLKPLFSSAIMVNNIMVSFYCLVLGITWGTGTVFILVRNGLLLGALAEIFAGAGLSLEFWSLILPHGILELFAVTLCGGAGLLIASAVVRPGEYTRMDALRLKAREAMKIAMGSIPILVIAGIIEGFITPAGISPGAKLIFAGFTAAAAALYVMSGRQEEKKGDSRNAGPVSV
ncbi:MAG: hypothetical protein CVU89_16445 [Firmicutes bacterium HGW-Firmicutes-14]|jgi:uncharacterized membrane protein SpoIIM required for sporulation|nr:MAG: hypothetical protein CVU89_16445 [Firmicutes bacterium HGW-Firmicutes-14]